jgi:hypothetical protein
MKRLIAMFVGLVLPLAAANAALMSVDTRFGRATGVIDTTSGLEWLKLPVASGLSVSQVLAGMAPGERFEGVHYATSAEFGTLLTQENYGPRHTTDVAQALAFFDLFGFYDAFRGFSAYYDMRWSDQIQQRFALTAQFLTIGDPIREVDFDSQASYLGRGESRASHWLVLEPRTVPEPATVMLLGPGIVALAMLGKRAGNKDPG